MKFVADLHMHSKFSRATSPDMSLEGLSRWAKIKGIDLIGTGDFTHPTWFAELKSKGVEADDGFVHFGAQKFVLSAEINNFWYVGEKLHRIHTCVLLPSFEVAEQVNGELGKKGDLAVDGRPTVKMSCAQMVEKIISICPKAIIFPAHAWTPWFSVFGARGGFDSLKEAYEDMAQHIYAIETGLSSDPAMNWRVSALDSVQLLSNSDSHSPAKIGREANVFDLDRQTYDEMYEAIRYKEKKRLALTYEFFPEEGKYHYDGHRACEIRMKPSERKKLNGKCPVCGKNLTVGVMSRVDDLADREEGIVPKNAHPFESLVPLAEIIGMVYDTAPSSVKVQEKYSELIQAFGNEFAVLHATREDLERATVPQIVDGILKVRDKKLFILPGYDGEFGTLSFEKPKEEVRRKARMDEAKQKHLGDY